MSPECQELLQSLAHTTAWLARIEREDPGQMGAALTERSRAIQAIRRWIAAERDASRSVGPDLVAQLISDLEKGKQVLLRRVMAREITRGDLMRVGGELQMLRHLQCSSVRTPVSLNCRG
jgi:hypothetical protein